MILKGSDAMFSKSKEKAYGNEIYGQIVNVSDYFLFTRPLLPQKKVTVRYFVDDKLYSVSQVIMDVLSKHDKELWICNHIRVLVDPVNPEYAYINEFDYPEYDL